MKFLYSKNPKFLQNFILGALNPGKEPGRSLELLRI
jgi:hypothetical protein